MNHGDLQGGEYLEMRKLSWESKIKAESKLGKTAKDLTAQYRIPDDSLQEAISVIEYVRFDAEAQSVSQ